MIYFYELNAFFIFIFILTLISIDEGNHNSSKRVRGSQQSDDGSWRFSRTADGYECGICGALKSSQKYITYHLWQRHSGTFSC